MYNMNKNMKNIHKNLNKILTGGGVKGYNGRNFWNVIS